MSIPVETKYLRFTEETNAFDYLYRAGQFIKETQDDLLAWKWVVLSLHGALYGFAICACHGTNPDNVTYKTKKGEKKLIGLDKALELCQDPQKMKMLIGSQPLVITEAQQESIMLLKKELRNMFEHYIPSVWAIEIHGLPKITMDILDVIRFLAIETRTYIHLDQSQIRKIKSIVYQSHKILMRSKLYKVLMVSNSA